MVDGPTLPMVPEQRLLLAAATQLPGASYLSCYGYRVVGDLDPGRLATATRRLAAAVPLLRAAFTGGRTLPTGMVVLPEREVFVDHGRVDDAAAFLAGVADRPVRLREDPLFQVALARHGRDHLVMTSWHHGIADASSIGLCTRWLGDLYSDRGGPPEAAGRWADFAADEAARLAATAEPGRYWAGQLRDAGPAELLPAGDRPLSGVGEAVRFTAAGAGFPARCRAAGGTPGAVLLAAALLAGGGDRPVVLPTTLAGREPPYEETVGLMMRSIMLRGEPGWSPAEARRGVLRQLAGGWRHRHESLLTVAEHDPAAAARLAAGPLPFFAQLLDVPRRELDLAGCVTGTAYDGFARTARFGVELHLRPAPDGAVAGAAGFDTARYDRAAVAAAADRYRDLVERVVADRPAAAAVVAR